MEETISSISNLMAETQSLSWSSKKIKLYSPSILSTHILTEMCSNVVNYIHCVYVPSKH